MKQNKFIFILVGTGVISLLSGCKMNTSYLVNFDSEGGSLTPPQEVLKGHHIEKPKNPRRFDSKFLVWTYNGEEWDFENDVVNADITLHATYQCPDHNIIYQLAGGCFDHEVRTTFNQNEHVTFESPSKEYFTFTKWKEIEDMYNEYSWREIKDTTNKKDYDLTIRAFYEHIPDIYLTFGHYPQSVVLDEDLISELDKISTVDENGYMEYNDKLYYAFTTGNLSSYYNYVFESGPTVIRNHKYYFECAPIEWIPMFNNDNRITLFSKNALFMAQWNSNNAEKRYEKSDIRNYLNSTFINKAFTSEERSKLLLSEVINVESSCISPYTEVPDRETCYDYAYLPSVRDVLQPNTDGRTHNNEQLLDVDIAGYRTDYLIAEGYSNGLGSPDYCQTQYWTRFADNDRGAFYITCSSQSSLRYERTNVTAKMPIRPMIEVMVGDIYED